MKANIEGLFRLEIITRSLIMIMAIILSILGGGLFEGTDASIPATQREALIALYNSTDGDNWTKNNGWQDPPLDVDGFAMPGTENTWHGITCDGGNTTVWRGR